MCAAMVINVLTHTWFGNVYKALSWPRTISNLKLVFFLLLSLPHSKPLNTPLPHPFLVASQSQSHLSRIHLALIFTHRDRGLCHCSPSSLTTLTRTEAFRRHCSFTHSHQRPSVVTAPSLTRIRGLPSSLL